ncbi:MAG: glutamate ligase domain-containing protein, partial [Porticoccaceae bacterium]
AGRKIVVMGDMGELGDDSVNMHAGVGSYALEAGIDALYAVGELSASACAAFGGNHFQSKDLLVEALEQELARANAGRLPLTFLVKGSRSAGMENIVEHLITRGNT